jgi:hypothetical protein
MFLKLGRLPTSGKNAVLLGPIEGANLNVFNRIQQNKHSDLKTGVETASETQWILFRKLNDLSEKE